ncbi:MAG TPA: MarR family transcriptional regulator [Clostridia bacterium]|nr:MarR family transcriptional regulator [Clostridia bacterium]
MNFTNLYLLVRYAKAYGHEKIRVLGMSDNEHTICTFLFGHPNSSQDDVSNALKLDKTTVARALVTLESKGYVVRRQNPKNRRKNLLSLTEIGKENIKAVVGLYDQWLLTVSECLDPAEQELFNEYCKRLLAAAKKECE